MKQIYTFLLMTFLTASFGCSYFRDATFDPAFQGGYKHGDIFITQKDVLIKTHPNPPAPYIILGLDSRIETYKETGPIGLNKDVIGVLPKGARLKFSKILFYYNFDHGDSYVPIAEIIEDPYKGYEVSLGYVSENLYEQGVRRKRWYIKKYKFHVEDGDNLFIKKAEQ